MLFGEYAVLHGGAALVCAVERGVTCRAEPSDTLIIDGGAHGRAIRTTQATHGWRGAPLPFAQAVVDRLPDAPVAAYHLDSSALSVNGIKLGLGSSAASTVALVRALVPDAAPADVYARAQAAHRAVQGTGSGADIAASAYGGAIAYRWLTDASPNTVAAGDGHGWIDPLPRSRAHLCLVWAGQPASTPALVGRVRAWAQAEPAAHAMLMTRIATAAEEGIAAWRERTDLRPAARQTIAALTELGQQSGAPIVTAQHVELAKAVADLDVVVKPTGAGGGDLAWLVGASPAQERAALDRLRTAGHLGLPLAIVP